MNKIFIYFLMTIYIFSFNIQTIDSDFKRVNPANNKNTLFSFHSSIKDAKNAVVNIFTEKKVAQDLSPYYNDPYFRYFFDIPHNAVPRSRVERSLGSGVIISSDGYIITNYHVVGGADKIYISIPNFDDEIEAKMIGADRKSDIAIIKISKKNLPFLKFANSDKAKVGDIVFAIGNPFGVGESVTQGIISALNKSVGINVYENFIQTDASINVGNSGGALIDSRGALIGMNTAIISKTGGSVGIGFAIPSNMIKRITNDLVDYGEIQRGYLGVQIRDLNPNMQKRHDRQGALIMSVQRNSPASSIGLKKGDLITKINNKAITSAISLTSFVGLLKPDAKVKVTWIREDKEISKKTKLTSWNKIQIN